MPGMNTFFSTGKPASTERLETLAKIASNRLLGEGVALNDSIAKLAKENSLNPHQIDRVAEKANVFTHQAMWPNETDKTKVAFEVADPRKIKASVGHKEPSEEEGSTQSERGRPSGEFMGPPTSSPAAGPSLAELMGVSPQNGHNGLAGPSDKQKVIIIIQKTAAARQHVSDDLITLSMRYENEMSKAFWLTKQAVLGGIPFHDLYAVALQTGVGDIAAELLPKFQEKLAKEVGRSMVKVAWKAPEELIDRDVPVTVINGAQPLMVSLDALKRYRDQEQVYNMHLSRIDDENKIYSQRLRELT